MLPVIRKNCAQYLEQFRQEARYLEECLRQQVVRPHRTGNDLFLEIDRSRLSPDTRQWLLCHEGTPEGIRLLDLCWARAHLQVNGPKIFRPTLDQCLAMEQIAPQLPIADYAQPYPVMLVELPQAYSQRRSCPAASEPLAGTHAPVGVIIAHLAPPVSGLVITILLDSDAITVQSMVHAEATIEDMIVRDYGEDSYASTAWATMEERIILAGVQRLAVNAMLFLVQFGCRPLGPVNESHYRRLERYVQVARKNKRGLEESERNLRQAPQLFGMAQEIVLHDEARTSDDPDPGGDDGPRRPHWRRGHWKMQPYGPQRSLRRRLFIKPVLVNRHLLPGDTGAFETVYRIR